MSSETSLSFASNQILSTYRTENRDGREWLVVDGFPLSEGVLNKRFVPADEFGAFIPDWNGIPIVIRHPQKNGGSAKVPNPDVLEIGRFFNAKMDGKRLGGEHWLDKKLMEANKEGQIILERIYKNKPVEESTGYWSASIPETGVFNGKDYELVDKNIHPDHIALLVDEVGACSLADGCGLNRNEADGEEEKPSIKVEIFDNLAFIDGNLWQNVTGSLPEEGKKMWEKVYQAALEQYDGDKQKAAATAWAAVKKLYIQDKDGVWHKKETKQNQSNLDIPPDELLGLATLVAFVAE